jgi:hypothetical protein
MRSLSFKSAMPAAAVAAILAVAPIQLGSPLAFGFAQALAASPVGVGGGHALAKGSAAVRATAGVAGPNTNNVPHFSTGQGAGNPYGAKFGLYSQLR